VGLGEKKSEGEKKKIPLYTKGSLVLTNSSERFSLLILIF
jgi:hypothetical protein